MIEVSLVRNVSNRLDIVSSSKLLGFICYSKYLPEFVLGVCKSEEEVNILLPYTTKEHSLHLDYITIHENFRGAGYSLKAMKKFIRFSKSKNIKTINLLSKPALVKLYSSLGFTTIAPINDGDFFLMEITL